MDEDCVDSSKKKCFNIFFDQCDCSRRTTQCPITRRSWQSCKLWCCLCKPPKAAGSLDCTRLLIPSSVFFLSFHFLNVETNKSLCLFFPRLQVLAMSSRSWLSYSYQSRFHLTPLSYETLEYASGFASEQCPEGIVAISTNTLRYFFLHSSLSLESKYCLSVVFVLWLTTSGFLKK